MEIVDKRDMPKLVKFEDLDIGDVYKDEDSMVCIKISKQFKDGVPNTIYYRGEEWVTGYEYRSAEVVPLNAELVINN